MLCKPDYMSPMPKAPTSIFYGLIDTPIIQRNWKAT